MTNVFAVVSLAWGDHPGAGNPVALTASYISLNPSTGLALAGTHSGIVVTLPADYRDWKQAVMDALVAYAAASDEQEAIVRFIWPDFSSDKP